MMLNDFITEQLQDPEFKKEWENSEKDYQKLLAEVETEDKIKVTGSYRARRSRSVAGTF